MNFILLSFLLLFTDCKNDSNSAIVKIDLTSFQGEKISFITTDLLSYETIEYSEVVFDTINNIMEIDIEKPVFGRLNTKEESFPIYLEKGFNLKIVYTKNEGTVFTGKGAEINNYLTELRQIISTYFEREPDIYNLSQEIFKKELHSLNAFLKEINSDGLSPCENLLVKKIKDTKLFCYELHYLIFSHRKGNPIPEEEIPPWTDFEKNYELFDLQFEEYGVYLHFIIDIYFYNDIRNNDFNIEDSLMHLFYKQVDEKIRKLEIDYKLKEMLLARNLSWSFMMTGLNSSTQFVYDNFKDEYPNSKCLRSLKNTYSGFKQLEKGEIMPNIDYLTEDDLSFSILDLKGEIIYIDVWATWCSPCIKEFKFSKMLEKKYQEDEVSFVYLSIDDDKEKWKDYLRKNNDFKGIHLIGEENGVVLKKLQITGVPRYLILDSEGKIVNADAPEPSSNEIETLINKLLKKNKKSR